MRNCLIAATAAVLTTAGLAATASAQIVFLQDYETAVDGDIGTDNQLFVRYPNFSGSSSNVDSPQAAPDNDLQLVEGLVGGGQALQVRVRPTQDDPLTTDVDESGLGAPQRIRFLTNSGGNIDVNFASTGTIGFLIRTSDAPDDLQAGVTIEDDGRTDLNLLGLQPVANDGSVQLLQFPLDGSLVTFDTFFNTGGTGLGDGSVDAATFNVDSIGFATEAAVDSFTFTIDSIAFNPTGDLSALVPEPASLGLLSVAGLGLLRRRK